MSIIKKIELHGVKLLPITNLTVKKLQFQELKKKKKKPNVL